ncbi:unnamed protein product [Caenorhabditis auriculariae]|uniref:Uncharacterized protein n=1 Tax=Caenorhabditis auriculariae TaxID=2777116 RepID=A0A8S1HKT9_9PELO|nr:unnamed protein product [Caenorhabditis auriculariae]
MSHEIFGFATLVWICLAITYVLRKHRKRQLKFQKRMMRIWFEQIHSVYSIRTMELEVLRLQIADHRRILSNQKKEKS